MNPQYPIAAVERETGIPKDLLRQWERRYRFPLPARDDNGDRVYTQQDLDKLRLIRQLMERGKRPGKLMELEMAQLQAMLASHADDDAAALEQFLPLLRRRDLHAIRNWLQQRLASQGLRQFICHTVSQTNTDIGLAWERGELAVHEEHLYTEQIQSLLRQAIHDLYVDRQPPRVMLTTVPGEQHGLGCLMVEAMLRLDGCDVIPFGTEMPFQEIIEAAVSHRVDVVGLSFSAAFPATDAVVALAGLRQMLPPHIDIWAGGAALEARPSVTEGSLLTLSLEEVCAAAADWRVRHGAGAG